MRLLFRPPFLLAKFATAAEHCFHCRLSFVDDVGAHIELSTARSPRPKSRIRSHFQSIFPPHARTNPMRTCAWPCLLVCARVIVLQNFHTPRTREHKHTCTLAHTRTRYRFPVAVGASATKLYPLNAHQTAKTKPNARETALALVNVCVCVCARWCMCMLCMCGGVWSVRRNNRNSAARTMRLRLLLCFKRRSSSSSSAKCLRFEFDLSPITPPQPVTHSQRVHDDWQRCARMAKKP